MQSHTDTEELARWRIHVQPLSTTPPHIGLLTTESVLWYGNGRKWQKVGGWSWKLVGDVRFAHKQVGDARLKRLCLLIFKVKSCYILLAIYIYSNIKLTAKMLLDEIEGNVEINTLMFTKLDLAGRGETLKCQNLSLIDEFRGNWQFIEPAYHPAWNSVVLYIIMFRLSSAKILQK